jgi:hypothetical protein
VTGVISVSVGWNKHRIVIARYRGVCRSCRTPIEPGDKIVEAPGAEDEIADWISQGDDFGRGFGPRPLTWSHVDCRPAKVRWQAVLVKRRQRKASEGCFLSALVATLVVLSLASAVMGH